MPSSDVMRFGVIHEGERWLRPRRACDRRRWRFASISAFGLFVAGNATAAELCADLALPGASPACDIAKPGDCDLSANKYALVIGNNKYRSLYANDSSKPRDLKNAEDDARKVAQVLADNYGFKVRCVLNATSQQAEAEFRRLEEVTKLFGATEDRSIKSRLVLYYSGHGVRQSDADDGSLVFVDATRTNYKDTSTPLYTLRERLRDAAEIVAPIFIVDACRVLLISATAAQLPATAAAAPSGVTTAIPVGPKGLRATLDHPYHYFIGNAVPKGSAAPDDETRFAKFLITELKERGRSLDMIWDETRMEYMFAHKMNSAVYGPQSTSPASAVVKDIFRPDADKCEEYFGVPWRYVRRKGERSLRYALNSGYRPDRIACSAWKFALDDYSVRLDETIEPAQCITTDCGKALKCRFDTYFREACKTVPVIAEITAPMVVASAALETERLDAEVASSPLRQRQHRSLWSSGTRKGIIGIGSQRATAKLEPGSYRAVLKGVEPSKQWAEVVTTTRATDLRKLPNVSEARITPIPANTALNVDCKSLYCSQDWVGVRYRNPGDKEFWRGFISRESVSVVPADDTIAIAFDKNSVVPPGSTAEKIDAKLKSRKGRTASRMRLAARFSPTDAGQDGEALARQNALLRLAEIDSILRAKGSYKDLNIPEPKFELISADGAPPEVLIEFYADGKPATARR